MENQQICTSTFTGTERETTSNTGDIFVIASIALGTLMGAAIYKWVSETFGSWQSRMGRADPTNRGTPKR